MADVGVLYRKMPGGFYSVRVVASGARSKFSVSSTLVRGFQVYVVDGPSGTPEARFTVTLRDGSVVSRTLVPDAVPGGTP